MPASSRLSESSRGVLCYLGFMLAANLVWEFAQMPFYTLWSEGTSSQIFYSGLHCTVGDLLIAATSFGAAWLLAGRPSLAGGAPTPLVATALLIGVAFTAFSEFRSTQVTHSWSYSDLMPVIPGTAIGLIPLLQWIILPIVGISLTIGFAMSKAQIR